MESAIRQEDSAPRPEDVGTHEGVKCDVCDLKFRSFEDFRGHVPVSSRCKPHFVCMLCKERFGMPSRLVTVLRDSDQIVLRQSQQLLVCFKCKCKERPKKQYTRKIVKDSKKDLEEHVCRFASCLVCVNLSRRINSLELNNKYLFTEKKR